MSEPTQPQSVRVVPLGANRYLVESGGRHRMAYAVTSGTAVWVFIDGQVSVISQDVDASTEGSHGTDETALASPMPATVVAIEVRVGQRVQRGDVLVRLEAMKMELAVKAPRDATVSAIACRAGDVVQPGARLVELE